MNPPDLYAFVLRLEAPHSRERPTILGHHTQALFYELVRQIDPELSSALHRDVQNKPFTVALHRLVVQELGGGHRVPIVEVRITLMQARLFSTLTRALLANQHRSAFMLANTPLTLLEVCGTPERHPWAGFHSFAGIVEESKHQTVPARIGLQFVSPTAIGQGVRANGKPRHALLPTPELIFGSLARRWNELCPPELQIGAEMLSAALTDTVVSKANIQTRLFQHQVGSATQKGFEGECHYELPSDPELARILVQLADAAFYLGIGIKTARGMGQARRIMH
jgi:CRISPR-associated endoribonuclease Cas6